MPKYYCDYCDIFLTHDSVSVRKAHNTGWKHINQVVAYYREVDGDKVQEVVGKIAAAYAERQMPVPQQVVTLPLEPYAGPPSFHPRRFPGGSGSGSGSQRRGGGRFGDHQNSRGPRRAGGAGADMGGGRSRNDAPYARNPLPPPTASMYGGDSRMPRRGGYSPTHHQQHSPSGYTR
ncbi:U1 small nuclear ribonucleoprotein C [Coemansia sp. RSA 1939]|nr:U1 small nuclear ribonucleoprotein C [Coemansia sp. RSA 1939]KAJ2611360.1 U1 small nuclear ribonucleoprotein C [Coemansia sp. RSA 1804]